MFIDSDVKYVEGDRHRGETDIDIERYRYGFYHRTPEGPVAVLPAKWLDAGVMAIRPFLLLEKVAREARAGINLALTGRVSAQRTDDERESVVMSDAEKQKALEYWKETMGRPSDIAPGQVEVLKQTIQALLDSGEKVVLVDLPIPAWHRDASPYQPSYRRALAGLLQQFGDQLNFSSLSMDDLDNDLDYSDEVHAKQHMAKIWSTRLASKLDSFVCLDKPDKSSPKVTTLRSSEQVTTAAPGN